MYIVLFYLTNINCDESLIQINVRKPLNDLQSDKFISFSIDDRVYDYRDFPIYEYVIIISPFNIIASLIITLILLNIQFYSAKFTKSVKLLETGFIRVPITENFFPKNATEDIDGAGVDYDAWKIFHDWIMYV